MKVKVKIKTKKGRCIVWDVNKFLSNIFTVFGCSLFIILLAQLTYTYLFTFNY